MIKKRLKSFNKKSISIIIVLFLIITTVYQPNVVLATTQPRYETIADYLNELGLFLGGATGYNLSSTPDRSQGAVMVVRLLGKEDEARQMNYTHPFKDVPDWADAYVGYLYHEGITNGTGSDRYGATDLLSEAQYMTLMLRVLKYSDANGDFEWRESITKAYELNIITKDQYAYYMNASNTFLRDDMVLLSYKVLFASINTEGRALFEKLISEGAISPVGGFASAEDSLDALTIITSSGIYYPYIGASIKQSVTSAAELQFAIETAIFNMASKVTFNVSNVSNYGEVIKAATDNIQNYPGYFSMVSSYSYQYSNGVLVVDLYYYLTKQENLAARTKADTIITQIIHPGMSEFERELAIHDYLVDHTSYTQGIDPFNPDTANPNPYTMYGALIENSAVCQGYAEAFDYLCELAVLDAQVVTGEAEAGGAVIGHAWNIIKINGLYYQIDVTWDDPVTTDGSDVKSYNYFNITDTEMDISHNWVRTGLPSCNTTKDNYYYHFGLVVSGEQALNNYIRTGLLNKETEINVKVTNFTLSASKVSEILQNNGDTNWAQCLYYIQGDYNILQITDISYN